MTEIIWTCWNGSNNKKLGTRQICVDGQDGAGDGGTGSVGRAVSGAVRSGTEGKLEKMCDFMVLPAKKERYTFEDVLVWDENERVEIINGEAVMTAPPTTAHQLISGELFRQLANYLEGKKCRVIPAPFGVRLFEQDGDRPDDVDTVVEPDISVVCDRNKLDHRGCNGAPDMVIEILSLYPAA